MSALLAQVLSVRQIISRRQDSSRNEFMTVLTKKYPSNFMRLVYLALLHLEIGSLEDNNIQDCNSKKGLDKSPHGDLEESLDLILEWKNFN